MSYSGYYHWDDLGQRSVSIICDFYYTNWHLWTGNFIYQQLEYLSLNRIPLNLSLNVSSTCFTYTRGEMHIFHVFEQFDIL